MVVLLLLVNLILRSQLCDMCVFGSSNFLVLSHMPINQLRVIIRAVLVLFVMLSNLLLMLFLIRLNFFSMLVQVTLNCFSMLVMLYLNSLSRLCLLYLKFLSVLVVFYLHAQNEAEVERVRHKTSLSAEMRVAGSVFDVWMLTLTSFVCLSCSRYNWLLWDA